MKSGIVLTLLNAVLFFLPSSLLADWPTYRHDIARSGITQEKIATPLNALWLYQPLHAPSPAWEPPRDVPVEGILELPRVRFDDAFHVVTSGDAVFFGSSSDNQVRCLDAVSGKVRWSFFTGGPVRLAPTISAGKVYFGSDDGNVYCLKAADGQVVWQRHVGPDDRQLLGHGKMISRWPVRTGVMVDNGIAFYGAGIFPAEGVYVEAANASDGKLLWRNDTGGEATDTRASPQGYLLATSANLFVPQGRVSPSAYARSDGKRLYESTFGKTIGGTYAFLADNTLFTGTEEIIGFDGPTKAKVAWFDGRKVIVSGDTAFITTSNSMLALSRQSSTKAGLARFAMRDQRTRMHEEATTPRKDKSRLTQLIAQHTARLDVIAQELGKLPAGDAKRASLETERAQLEATRKSDQDALAKVEAKLVGIQKQFELIDKRIAEANEEMEKCVKWRLSCVVPDSLILAGTTLVAGGNGIVIAADSANGQKLWEQNVEGKVKGLAVSDGRLFVSTDTGAIYCFGAGAATSAKICESAAREPFAQDQLSGVYAAAAEAVVRESGQKRGYCLIVGCEDGRLALELARRTEMTIVGIGSDPARIAAARHALAAAGLYGKRVTLDCGEADHLPYAQYFANLIVSESAVLGRMPGVAASEIQRVLKPCGGVALIGQPAEAKGKCDVLDGEALRRLLPGAQVPKIGGVWAKLTRGALPNAGSWTHEYANAANTACSDDSFVKCPLGLLWFGDPGPLQMVSRHTRAASPLAANGVLFVQTENGVGAYDAYNGLKLWNYEIPNVVRTRTSDTSANLAADGKSFFVVNKDRCVRLDAMTGVVRNTFIAPPSKNAKATWGHIGIVDGILVGSTGTNIFSDAVFACDVDTGKLLWRHEASIQNATISIAEGRVFFTDPPPSGKRRFGQVSAVAPIRTVTALDLQTGKVAWQKSVDLSGCVGGPHWGTLGGMVNDGVLVLFGVYTDGHFWKEFFAKQFDQRRIVALSSRDGSQIWSRKISYRVRPLIIGNTLHAEPWAYDLKTGEQRMRTNPITGRSEPWQFARPGHHCGAPAAAPNMLLFRSYYLGYYDLIGDDGTSTFGGQRPGCWINFVAANGLVTMPEASSGCMCPFPNQCTIALAPRQENRAWSKVSLVGELKPVKHLAINLGGPGDRRDNAGTLWLGYPRQKGSLVLPLGFDAGMLPGGGYLAQSPDSLKVSGTAEPWLYTFGVRGMKFLKIPLLDAGDGTGKFTVRLGFAEMDDVKVGERVFDVAIQGKPVLKKFDVLREAGSARKAVVKEFRGVIAEDALKIEFTPKTKGINPRTLPILQTVEIVRESMLGIGVTAPEFVLNNETPAQTKEIALANQTDQPFTGKLRIVAPQDFAVTPSETSLSLGIGDKKRISVKIAAPPLTHAGKQIARLELVRADGTVAVQRDLAVENLGSRSRRVFQAVADATCTERSPATNYGTSPSLMVDGGDAKMYDHHYSVAYLRFRIEVPGRPIAVTLRIHNAGNPTSKGGSICLVTEPWDEEQVTFANRPKSGEVLGTIGVVNEHDVLEVPLKLPALNSKDISFAIEPLNTDGVDYISREGGKAAELIVEYEK